MSTNNSNISFTCFVPPPHTHTHTTHNTQQAHAAQGREAGDAAPAPRLGRKEGLTDLRDYARHIISYTLLEPW